MAGRCGCAGSGCACCFSPGTGSNEITFGGNGASGNCITGSIRYSTDDGNIAQRGSDGGLYVPADGGGS